MNTKKSQIVIFNKDFFHPREKLDCTFSLFGAILETVSFYKYLGVIFQEDGKWNLSLDLNMLKAQHTLGELLQAGIGEDGLQIGHSSRLYLACAKPQLLYGSEVIPLSKTLLETADTHLIKVARNILGKKGDACVIFEALRRDLDWLSIGSDSFGLSKLRFFGHICRSSNHSLLKKIFLFRLQELQNSQELAFSPRQFQARNCQPPWVYEAISHILPKYSLQLYIDPTVTGAVSKLDWKRKIKTAIKKVDFQN